MYIGVILRAHLVHGESVNRTFNATPTERLQQHPLLFTTNHTIDRTFFLWHDLHILVTAPFC